MYAMDDFCEASREGDEVNNGDGWIRKAMELEASSMASHFSVWIIECVSK